MPLPTDGAEYQRIRDSHSRKKDWSCWGPYLTEREWGTLREDYSDDAQSWDYFTHDQARSRAYRWGEDGLLGITDRRCRLCFSIALWNEKDPFLKERLFGLTGNGECHFYSSIAVFVWNRSFLTDHPSKTTLRNDSIIERDWSAVWIILSSISSSLFPSFRR